MQPSINAADLLACHADTLIEPFEGLRLTAYQDSNGIWTNGYGNTHCVSASTPPITEDEAIADLKRNLRSAENDICSVVTVPLNQNEFDALTSFDFNIGDGHLFNSTTLRLLNAGDRQGAADAMPMWDKADGAISPGLLRRRQAERALFLTAVN